MIQTYDYHNWQFQKRDSYQLDYAQEYYEKLMCQLTMSNSTLMRENQRYQVRFEVSQSFLPVRLFSSVRFCTEIEVRNKKLKAWTTVEKVSLVW